MEYNYIELNTPDLSMQSVYKQVNTINYILFNSSKLYFSIKNTKQYEF